MPFCIGLIIVGLYLQNFSDPTSLRHLTGQLMLFSSAGLFGATIGSMLTNLVGLNHDEQLLNRISKMFSAHSSLAQNHKELKPFVETFYIYRKTHNKNDKAIWICEKVKFSNLNNMFLDGVVIEAVQASGKTTYAPHAYLTNDRRLIITESPTPEAEQTVVHVYPDTREIHLDTGIAGIAVAETYFPNQRIIRPVILSKSIIEDIEPSVIEDPKKQNALDAHWNKVWVPHIMPSPLGPQISKISNHKELKTSTIEQYLATSSEATILQTWTPDETALKNAYKNFLDNGGSLTVCLLNPDENGYAGDRSVVIGKRDRSYVPNEIRKNLDYFSELADLCKSNNKGCVRILTYNTLPSYPAYVFDEGLIIGHFWNNTESNTGLQTEISSSDALYATIRDRIEEFMESFGSEYSSREHAQL